MAVTYEAWKLGGVLSDCWKVEEVARSQRHGSDTERGNKLAFVMIDTQEAVQGTE